VRMQRQFRSIQGNPSATEEETAYLGRSSRVIKKLFDFFYYQTDRIFIIGAPVNPFLIFDVFDQSQDSCGDFRRRLDILCAFRIFGAKLLIRDAKPKWVMNPGDANPDSPIVQAKAIGADWRKARGIRSPIHRSESGSGPD